MSDILTEMQGTFGRIRLNRPKVINPLKLGMIQDITSALEMAAPVFGYRSMVEVTSNVFASYLTGSQTAIF